MKPSLKPITSSIHEIKKELALRDHPELVDLCIRLARFKVENKELFSYLLFHAGNEEIYIESVKNEMEDQFSGINTNQIYLAKKTIRKVLKTANKHIRFSGKQSTEITIRIHFCKILLESKVPLKRFPVIENLYVNQLKKIDAVLAKLDEDLQYDYQHEIDLINEY